MTPAAKLQEEISRKDQAIVIAMETNMNLSAAIRRLMDENRSLRNRLEFVEKEMRDRATVAPIDDLDKCVDAAMRRMFELMGRALSMNGD